jgi:hypothetical protein
MTSLTGPRLGASLLFCGTMAAAQMASGGTIAAPGPAQASAGDGAFEIAQLSGGGRRGATTLPARGGRPGGGGASTLPAPGGRPGGGASTLPSPGGRPGGGRPPATQLPAPGGRPGGGHPPGHHPGYRPPHHHPGYRPPYHHHHGHYGHYHHRYGYHAPLLGAMAIGAVVRALPADCVGHYHDGQTYYVCGQTWLQLQPGSTSTYVVTKPLY